MERSEAISAAIGILRSRLAGNAPPAFDSAEYHAEIDALKHICNILDGSVTNELGVALLRTLIDGSQAAMLAERAALQAQIAARQSNGAAS